MATFQINRALGDLVRALKLYNIWVYQAYHSISSKYRRSLLGPFWIAGSMVATSLSLAIVFGGLFGQSLRDILPYITSGLLVWTAVSMPLSEAPEIFVGSSHTIRNHAYPFMYYVIEMVCRNFLMFLHNFVVFFVITLCVHAVKPIHWTIIPGLVLIYLIATVYSALSAMIAARFRDIRFIFPYIAQLLFFVTPIFWKPELIHGPKRLIADLNPLHHLVQLARAPLLGQAPTMDNWTSALGILAAGAVVWLLAFAVYRRRIAFWV